MSRKRRIERPAVVRTPLITRNHIVIMLLLVVVIGIIYGQVHKFQFVRYDDGDYIFRNPNIANGITLQSLKWAFSFSGYAANWHPLTWISHMIDYKLYGLHAGGHHVTGLIIHILSTLILFLAMCKMTGSIWKGAFVAALFGIHPVHVESVAWVSERKDVLSTMFLMLTLLTYAYYAERRTAKLYLGSLALFALGLMAKPMLVSLPLLLLMLDWWPLRRFDARNRSSAPARQLILEKIPFLVMAAISSAITVVVQHKGGAVQALTTYSLAVRIDNTLVSYVSYIGKTIFPMKLAVFYPHPGNTLPEIAVVLSGMVLVGITAASIALAKRHPYFLIGWLWFVVTLVPVIGIVQVGWQGMADRYTYVPIIGLFIIAAWGLPDVLDRLLQSVATEDEVVEMDPKRRAIALAVPAFLVIALLIPMAYKQTSTWKNNFTLFQHALDTNMQNRLAAINLGCNFADIGNYQEAAKMLAQAVKVYPRDAWAQANYGNALVYTGEIDEAVRHYREAVKIKGDLDIAHSGLGRALYEKGDLQGAADECREALRLNPDNAYAHNNYGMVCGGAALRMQDTKQTTQLFDLALKEFNKAISLKPDFPEAYTNIGLVYALNGKYKEALEEYQKALSCNPKFVPAHNRMAIELYNLGDYEQSWAEVKIVRDLGGTPNAEFLAALVKKMPEPAD